MTELSAISRLLWLSDDLPPTDRQAETAPELDALLPSVLDRAFRGEL